MPSIILDARSRDREPFLISFRGDVRARIDLEDGFNRRAEASRSNLRQTLADKVALALDAATELGYTVSPMDCLRDRDGNICICSFLLMKPG